jgi:hypothetical protein
MPIPTQSYVYEQLLQQINGNAAILFLGSGSTRNCRQANGSRGVTGQELANEILKHLNGGKDPGFEVSLTEASELAAGWDPAGRAGLDRFVEKRLTNLQPTAGHYIATTFPWRAIITTNYNRVVEDAWGSAHADGYAARELVVLRTDEEVRRHAGEGGRMRLYKPHGCVTIQQQVDDRMVLTSQDYFESERVRPRIYEEIRSLAKGCTTLFMGYSLNDYTFRNIFYELFKQLGTWNARSFSVSPVGPELRFRWMERAMDRSFNTTLVDDSFDTFMVRLALARGSLAREAKGRVQQQWPNLVADGGPYATSLDLKDVLALPDA